MGDITLWRQNDTLIAVKAYNLALVADSYRAKESSATRTLDTFVIISIYSENSDEFLLSQEDSIMFSSSLTLPGQS